MFPTFIQLTTRHPRYFSLMGACIFILGTLLWFEYSYNQNTTITQQEIVPVSKTEEDILREQFAILDSLKSAEPDTSTEEEKEELLTSLMPEDPKDGMTEEEQLRILDSLKAE